ncbi:hypothetical protein OSB04_001717 [Centaurea solstitialis]|uniref:BED-type domain-containing protein n=1 Tax=Centaurea solstitialis TaxID=347529 RepID=A0AA38U233_9ASTR|nr:hypothetical protein OSB04_001717 [Centaurea solstitialis]
MIGNGRVREPISVWLHGWMTACARNVTELTKGTVWWEAQGTTNVVRVDTWLGIARTPEPVINVDDESREDELRAIEARSGWVDRGSIGEFDIALGMDWLASNNANIEYFPAPVEEILFPSCSMTDLCPEALGELFLKDAYPIDVDVSDAVEQSQKQMPQVGDKRKSSVWNHYDDIRYVNTGKVSKAKCKYCSKWREDDDPNITSMGDEMGKKFDRYYGDFGKTNVMVLVAAALDPRYKMRFMKFSYRKISPLGSNKVIDIYDQVYVVLKKLYDHYASVSLSSKNDSSSSFVNNDGGQSYVGMVNNKQMRKIYHEFYENDVGNATEKFELDEYLDSPPEKMDVESL